MKIPEAVTLAPGVTPAFDAYLMVDWSATSTRKTGKDSVWWALLEWVGDAAAVESGNCPTRSELVTWVEAQLSGRLCDHRTLIGFDFPFGYPRGFAAALGLASTGEAPWRETWRRIAAQITDDPDNCNNRFAVAAALNADVSGGFGPFYGRPPSVADGIARTLSAKQAGCFEFPLQAVRGQVLARLREADRYAGVSSSAWFVYGGGNSVGGQALVGIPRVLALREAFPDARVWPFETGPVLPPRSEARIVLTEIYPSLFHVRDAATGEVHDKLQVEAAARRFAALDARGQLAAAFAALPPDPAVLREEGWVLGAPEVRSA